MSDQRTVSITASEPDDVKEEEFFEAHEDAYSGPLTILAANRNDVLEVTGSV